MNILIQNTQFTGKQLLHLERVDSTNNYAKQVIANSTPKDGTVILADEQFAGRGQAGNKWQSEAGKNLTFSILYHTSFLRADEQFYLNMAVSLGVRKAIEMEMKGKEESRIENQESRIKYEDIEKSFVADLFSVTIKWPNDIFAGEKKIAGVLIENTIQGQFLNYSVIGIGINVNQTVFETGLSASSIALLNNKQADLVQLFKNALYLIEYYFLKLKMKDYAAIKTAYMAHLMGYGKCLTYRKGQVVFEGSITDIDPAGKLMLQVGDYVQTFQFKEIERVF